MKGGRVVIQALREQDIRIAFGIPGGHNIQVFDALRTCRDIRHISARHEQNAVFMADGYSRATGEIAAAILVSGPGVGC